MSWLKKAMESEELYEAVGECDDRECVEAVLRDAGVEWEGKSFPNGDSILLADVGGKRVVIDPDFPSIKTAYDWVYSMDSWKLSGHVEPEDFNAAFWGGRELVSPLYHGVSGGRMPNDDKVSKVMVEGLDPRTETRGISNRSTGSAVFATSEQEDAAGYGPAVVEIDVAAMKADGYMPEVSRESPIEEEKMRDRLAWSIGIDDWDNHRYDELASEGIRETTYVFFGKIPSKYLRRVV